MGGKMKIYKYRGLRADNLELFEAHLIIEEVTDTIVRARIIKSDYEKLPEGTIKKIPLKLWVETTDSHHITCEELSDDEPINILPR